MKSLRRAVFALFFFLLLTSVSSAHPPKEVLPSWDGKGNLKVEIVHNVEDPQKHYVNHVNIYLNGKLIQQKDYTQQGTNNGETLTFSLGNLPSGSTIKVEATCVIFGTTTGSLVIP